MFTHSLKLLVTCSHVTKYQLTGFYYCNCSAYIIHSDFYGPVFMSRVQSIYDLINGILDCVIINANRYRL